MDIDRLITGYSTRGELVNISVNHNVDMSYVLFERDRKRWREHAHWAMRSLTFNDTKHFYMPSEDLGNLFWDLITELYETTTYQGKLDTELFDRLWRIFGKIVAEVDEEKGTNYFGALFESNFMTIPELKRP